MSWKPPTLSDWIVILACWLALVAAVARGVYLKLFHKPARPEPEYPINDWRQHHWHSEEKER